LTPSRSTSSRATGDWKIAFFDDCAIYDCKFWNYKQCDVNPKTGEAAIVMTNGNDELKVTVGKQKNGKRQMTINLKPQISNLKPQTSNLKSQISNLKSQTSCSHIASVTTTRNSPPTTSSWHCSRVGLNGLTRLLLSSRHNSPSRRRYVNPVNSTR
jgi:hypothetical protein